MSLDQNEPRIYDETPNKINQKLHPSRGGWLLVLWLLDRLHVLFGILDLLDQRRRDQEMLDRFGILVDFGHGRAGDAAPGD